MILCLLGFSNMAYAQFGAGVRYSKISDGYWQDAFALNGQTGYPDKHISAYVLYWFRLKEKRIEFLPEFGYSTSSGNSGTDELRSSFTSAYFLINTDVYFLDFASDCNCPTFSKQNKILQRGIFIEISPGIEMRTLKLEYTAVDGSPATRKFQKTVPGVNAGLGFDIGISDLITVTPTAGINLRTGTAWSGLEPFLGVEQQVSENNSRNQDASPYIGVRILFRPDYLRGRS